LEGKARKLKSAPRNDADDDDKPVLAEGMTLLTRAAVLVGVTTCEVRIVDDAIVAVE
jgi:hypothetical protein